MPSTGALHPTSPPDKPWLGNTLVSACGLDPFTFRGPLLAPPHQKISSHSETPALRFRQRTYSSPLDTSTAFTPFCSFTSETTANMIIYKVCCCPAVRCCAATPPCTPQHPGCRSRRSHASLTFLAGHPHRRRDHLRLVRPQGDRRRCLRVRLQEDHRRRRDLWCAPMPRARLHSRQF